VRNQLAKRAKCFRAIRSDACQDPTSLKMVETLALSRVRNSVRFLAKDLKKSFCQKRVQVRLLMNFFGRGAQPTNSEGKFSFGLIVKSDWTKGYRYEGSSPEMENHMRSDQSHCDHEMPAPKPGQSIILEGENIEVDPPRRLVQSFRALWGDDVKSEGT